MALTHEEKTSVVSDVSSLATGAQSMIAASYHGFNVAEMTDLRKRARQHGVYLRVVKNTLARRAVQGTNFECMADGFRGQLVLAFSQDDPAGAARLFKEFSDDYREVDIRMVSLGGELLAASEFERLANLPSREVALSMLLAVMQAPVVKFLRTLKEVPAGFVRAVMAVKDQKESAS